MQCPKCQYQRKTTDTCPDWQCPSCEIAYNKFTNNCSESSLRTEGTSPTTNEQEETEIKFEPSGVVRRRGALTLIFGSAMAVLSATVLLNFFIGPGVIVIPLFFAVVAAGGLVELISGINLDRIVKSWNEFEQTRAAHTIKYTLFGVSVLALIIVFIRIKPT
jgi:hypothetical protein